MSGHTTGLVARYRELIADAERTRQDLIARQNAHAGVAKQLAAACERKQVRLVSGAVVTVATASVDIFGAVLTTTDGQRFDLDQIEEVL